MVGSADFALLVITCIIIIIDLWVAVGAHDAAGGSVVSPLIIDQCFDCCQLFRCTNVLLLARKLPSLGHVIGVIWSRLGG